MQPHDKEKRGWRKPLPHSFAWKALVVVILGALALGIIEFNYPGRLHGLDAEVVVAVCVVVWWVCVGIERAYSWARNRNFVGGYGSAESSEERDGAKLS
jgi:uncharacterized membrane protein HdeD (DUF308 family)